MFTAMRDYQPKKRNKYQLPTPVYHQTLWLIRDYDRIAAELEAILLESPDPPDGMPSCNTLSDEVARKAERRDQLLTKKLAIDKSLDRIPPEYRRGVWENVQLRKPFPIDADRATYGRQKSLFIREVAILMGFVEKK